jgi:CheY-like chemotaxis protein
MKPEAFDNVRILIVDGKPGNARLLRAIFLTLGVTEVTLAEDTGRALDLLAGRAFQAVFCDETVGPLNAPAFVSAVRRSKAVGNPRIPILLTANAPKRGQVERVRDAGVNDLIVRPLTTGAVKRKLLGVLSPTKVFVATESFCGPDRRRAHDRLGARNPEREPRITPRMRRRTDTETWEV